MRSPLTLLSLVAALSACGDSGLNQNANPDLNVARLPDLAAAPPDLTVSRDLTATAPDLITASDFGGIQCGMEVCGAGQK